MITQRIKHKSVQSQKRKNLAIEILYSHFFFHTKEPIRNHLIFEYILHRQHTRSEFQRIRTYADGVLTSKDNLNQCLTLFSAKDNLSIEPTLFLELVPQPSSANKNDKQ